MQVTGLYELASMWASQVLTTRVTWTRSSTAQAPPAEPSSAGAMARVAPEGRASAARRVALAPRTVHAVHPVPAAWQLAWHTPGPHARTQERRGADVRRAHGWGASPATRPCGNPLPVEDSQRDAHNAEDWREAEEVILYSS